MRWQRIAVGFAVILLLTAFGCRRQTSTNTNASNGNTVNIPVTTQPTTTNTNRTVEPETPKLTTEEELRRLVAAFAERYGSYSNQTNFGNLESLYVFMTSSFAKSTRDFVEAERKKGRDTSIYYGISTRVTSITTRSIDERRSQSSFLVQTLRKETIGATHNIQTFQEAILIDLKRDGGAWKVNDAVWQGRQ